MSGRSMATEELQGRAQLVLKHGNPSPILTRPRGPSTQWFLDLFKYHRDTKNTTGIIDPQCGGSLTPFLHIENTLPLITGGFSMGYEIKVLDTCTMEYTVLSETSNFYMSNSLPLIEPNRFTRVRLMYSRIFVSRGKG